MDVVECLRGYIRELEADLDLHERCAEWAVQEAHRAQRSVVVLLDALRAIEAYPAAARDVARSVLEAFADGTPGR